MYEGEFCLYIFYAWLAVISSPSPKQGPSTVSIGDFPDHATFREKGAKLACVDKLGVLLSLTLCNKANFDPLQQVKYDGLDRM